MPSNDREVWIAIVSTPPGSAELNYLTYAIYSFEKYEWYDQIEKQKGKPPTSSDINDWISQITDSRIRVWRENAARAFDVAARTYMKDQLIQERQHLVDNHVVSAIEAHFDDFRHSLENAERSSSFGKQLFIGFVAAILSPIILGIIILAIQAADLWPTASGLSHFFHPQHETSSPGAVQKP